MRKILYLHGLESKQGGQKVNYLCSKYLTLAPSLDYRDPECFNEIFNIIKKDKFDLIIGSSMGGYLGFTMGEIFKIKTLLLNPALHSRTFEPKNSYNIDYSDKYDRIKHQVILGEEDDIINYEKTLLYLKNNNVNFNKEIIKSMGHRTNYGVFKSKIDSFEF